MINIVFLLLVFFLLTAQIAPPEPFEVTPPEASSDSSAEAEIVVFLSSDGALGFREITGEAVVLAALADLLAAGACAGVPCSEPPLLSVRADARVSAAALAAVLPKFAAIGFREAQIVTTLQ